MRHGMSPKDACLDACKRVARNFDNDKDRLLKVDINFYALRNDGAFAGAGLWKGASIAVNDGGLSRLEKLPWLLER